MREELIYREHGRERKETEARIDERPLISQKIKNYINEQIHNLLENQRKNKEKEILQLRGEKEPQDEKNEKKGKSKDVQKKQSEMEKETTKETEIIPNEESIGEDELIKAKLGQEFVKCARLVLIWKRVERRLEQISNKSEDSKYFSFP